MPYSFTKIEEDKSKTITFVFSFLIIFYFLSAWLIAALAKNFLIMEGRSYDHNLSWAPLNFSETFMVLLVSLIVSAGHWLFSVQNVIANMLKVLDAEPLNPDDTYHQMFRNILDEVAVATGGNAIEGVVVPTMAMNAFALSDFSGRSMIGVTEGLLSKLNRAQIEAVVGHEAAHIVSGDCLGTTISTSIFALYNGLLNGITKLLDQSRYTRSSYGYRKSGDSAGGVVVFLLLIYLILMVTRFLSLLIRMFVSREREFRADAVSVRLTRDPLSLAEALYKISSRWRGSGLAGEELEAIFIVNPQFSNLDEQSGMLADLFSTHPPVDQRLAVLLDIAHSDLKSLDEKIKEEPSFKKSLPDFVAVKPQPATPAVPVQWMIHQDGAWRGPFSLTQMTGLNGLKPETWIRKNDGPVIPMYDDPQLRDLLQNRIPVTPAPELLNAKPPEVEVLMCPRCHLKLSPIYYEGGKILRCFYCSGVLVSENNVKRIIIRDEFTFSEKIQRLAQGIRETRDKWGQGTQHIKTANLLTCPQCNPLNVKMDHRFYTAAYPVEIDQCFTCGSIWFDPDELEVLQCLIEQRSQERDEKHEK